MMLRAVTCLAFMTLGSCAGAAPTGVSLGFSSYESTPVVVTDFSLNDAGFGMVPLVVDGRAEMRPNEGLSRMDMTAGGRGSSYRLSAKWVDLTTGKAWAAEVAVPVKPLNRIDGGRVELAPVFGPNGLLIVTSDRMTGAGAGEKVDVARVCAKADPAGDRDYRKDPGTLPGLRESLGGKRPSATVKMC